MKWTLLCVARLVIFGFAFATQHRRPHEWAIGTKLLRKLCAMLKVMVTASVVMIVTPLSVDAQSVAKVPQIGFLLIDPPPPDGPGFYDAFREGLREIGYVEGHNIRIEPRFAAGNMDLLPVLAAELVRLKVDVIVTDSTISTIVAKRVITTIPIVFASAVDPVASGVVNSLAHPGGNITGFALISSELVGKRLQLLKETFPRIKRVAVLWNPLHPAHPAALKEIATAARTLRLKIQDFPVDSPAGFEPAFSKMGHWAADAVFVFDDGFLDFHRKLIGDLAIKGRLPSIFGYRLFVEGGGLMSYGPDLADQFRRSGKLVDKILKGAKPGDLPVEQPARFELVVNIKTMKALGITIPQSILLRADAVIK